MHLLNYPSKNQKQQETLILSSQQREATHGIWRGSRAESRGRRRRKARTADEATGGGSQQRGDGGNLMRRSALARTSAAAARTCSRRGDAQAEAAATEKTRRARGGWRPEATCITRWWPKLGGAQPHLEALDKPEGVHGRAEPMAARKPGGVAAHRGDGIQRTCAWRDRSPGG